MPNIFSYLFASAYSGFSPLLSAVSATCTVNGQPAQCPSWLTTFSTAFLLFYIAALIFFIVTVWKIFSKAGRPGWAAIIPIYNTIVMLQIANKPVWWIFLYLIPFVNIIIGVIVVYNLAKVFGKGGGFTLGLILLPIIFYPILAFGKSTYLPTSQPAAPTAPPPQAPPVIPQQPISQ